MNVRDALIDSTKRLSKDDIKYPAMEARILVCHTLLQSQEYIIRHSQRELTKEESEKLDFLIERRCKLEPIAYIVGKKEFFGRDFLVNKNVLIPRPDSEILIESLIKDYSPDSTLNILELGVGSGCLITTLLLEFVNAKGLGLDIDINALSIATINKKTYNLESRLELIQSDWFNAISEQKFDVIISNPPYISSNIDVARETLLHEPHLALFAENNGLKAYEEIAANGRNFLLPGSSLYIEIGYDQKTAVTNIFIKRGYQLIGFSKDLAGHVRCLKFCLSTKTIA